MAAAIRQAIQNKSILEKLLQRIVVRSSFRLSSMRTLTLILRLHLSTDDERRGDTTRLAAIAWIQ